MDPLGRWTTSHASQALGADPYVYVRDIPSPWIDFLP